MVSQIVYACRRLLSPPDTHGWRLYYHEGDLIIGYDPHVASIFDMRSLKPLARPNMTHPPLKVCLMGSTCKLENLIDYDYLSTMNLS